MPLSLPNLDDLGWDDLLREGRGLIPAWAPEWTDHNPSDPGITLIELFAYFSEKLIYRLNRVSDANTKEFLRLMNGPEWKMPGTGSLAEEKRLAVQSVSKLRRAVTAADFEKFACAVPGVARAKCIAQRNLERNEPGARTRESPGHISIVVLAEKGPMTSNKLVASVKADLEPKRLLTTRVHVVSPRYLNLRVRLNIAPKPGQPAARAQRAAVERLQLFLDPRSGGFGKKGWAFGGNVYVSDIYRALGDVAEIESVSPARDSSGKFLDVLIVEPGAAGRLRRNRRGEIDAVLLQPDELVEAKIDPADISALPYGQQR